MNKQPTRADLKAAEALMGGTVMNDAATKPNAPSAPQDQPNEPGFTDHEVPPETHEQAVIRLSKLPAMSYDQIREAEAKRLNLRLTTLDDEVRKARGDGDEPKHGRRLAFKTHEPHPDSVNLNEVLNDLAAALDRHVILSPSARDGVVLWIAHTWVYSRFQHTPRLSITSPEMRCGKSTVLDVLAATCLSPLKADSISSSSVFRTVEALSPLTMLIDEADSFLGQNEELRGVLNSGFERSGNVVRTVEIKDEWVAVQFMTFAPVAVAAIKRIPGTLEDRSVPIRLERKNASQIVTKMRTPGARQALATIGRKLARWAKDGAEMLDENPSIPATMGDREGDISVPLLSIADAAGPAWAARGRRALLTLFGDRANNDESGATGAMLLSDIRDVFKEINQNRIASVDLANRLGAMEDRPWAEWKQGKAMSAPQLSRALAPFRIRPHPMRMGGAIDRVVKGYQADHFADAWTRYLSDESSGGGSSGYTVTPHATPQKTQFSNGYTPDPTTDDVTDEKRRKVSNSATCNPVTVQKGEAGEKEQVSTGIEGDEPGIDGGWL